MGHMQNIQPKAVDTARFTLMESIGYPVIVSDIQGTILYANQFALSYFSQSLNYLKKQQVQELLSFKLDVDEQEHIAQALEAQKRQFVIKEKVDHVWQVRCDETDEWHYLWLQQAISADKDTQDYLKQMQHLVSVLAHEIKNPLAGMRGAAQILSEDVKSDMQHFTTLLMREIDRISGLVESLSFFEEQPDEQRKWLNIHALIHQAKEIVSLGTDRNVTIHEEYDPSLPDLFIDEHRLIQVLTNLLKNAVEAAHTGQKITIKTAYQHDLKYKQTKTPFVISITNHNAHISDDVLKELFTPFKSTKSTGKGLGLCISQQIIHQYGGDVTLANHDGNVVCQIALPHLKDKK